VIVRYPDLRSGREDLDDVRARRDEIFSRLGVISR
jgi:hypothetical protein